MELYMYIFCLLYFNTTTSGIGRKNTVVYITLQILTNVCNFCIVLRINAAGNTSTEIAHITISVCTHYLVKWKTSKCVPYFHIRSGYGSAKITGIIQDVTELQKNKKGAVYIFL